LNQGSQFLNGQWLIGAADVGDKQDVWETGFQGARQQQVVLKYDS
jgi:hypothetical protein